MLFTFTKLITLAYSKMKETTSAVIFVSILVVGSSKFCAEDSTDTLRCNYIPTDIPAGISKVRLVDFLNEPGNAWINSSYFQTDNWALVKYLELLDTADNRGIDLMASCFSGLRSLVELKINILGNFNHLEADVFLGLENVNTLDFSDCPRADFKSFIQTLNGSLKLPRLENLFISNLGVYLDPSVIDNSVTDILKHKKIKHLDLSRSQISYINLTALAKDLHHLKILNLSHSTVSDGFGTYRSINDVHLDMLDFSNAAVPKTWVNVLPGKVIVSNRAFEKGLLKFEKKILLAIRNINASGILYKLSIWIENCTLIIDEPVPWRINGVTLRYNNVRHLDVNVQCEENKIRNFENLDFAYNGLEFINPTIFICIPRLSKIDFSHNQFYKMAEENTDLFAILFKPLSRLRWINLSSNNLKTVPEYFFEYNFNLENIDLSGNRLKGMTLKISQLSMLQVLNLQGNLIQILDGESLNKLNSFHPETFNNGSRTHLLLADNPISCSKCQAKNSIKWLTMTTRFNITLARLTCVNEEGKRENIDKETVNTVQKICVRKTILLSLSIVAGVVVLMTCLTALLVFKRRQYIRMRGKKDTVLQRLKEGEGCFEFAVFLAFSSEDKDFVDNHVDNQLKENLRDMTAIERNLVCTGDVYFRPGYPILDEAVRCLERSSVMLGVVSNQFCESEFCHSELKEAFHLNKPIVLMLKDHVDEHLMKPVMKMLFKSNVRILWTLNNGEHIMKNSWENVCMAILDLIADNL